MMSSPRPLPFRPFAQNALQYSVMFLLTAFCVASAAAEATPSDPQQLCGTVLTPEEGAAQWRRWVLDGTAWEPGSAQPSNACLIPIAGHIVRTTEGNAGMPLSQYDQAILDANVAFAPAGFAFFSVSVDYIDSDHFYVEEFSFDDLRSQNVVPNAINIYFTPNGYFPYCGLSSFTTSPVQGIIMANTCTGQPNNHSTFPHEIGHYFDLYHTHEPYFGYELVDGSNCSTAGDLLCDTPADPTLGYVNMDQACTYFGTARDANGDLYDPDTSQYMSYAYPKDCRIRFSPEAHARVQSTLINFRPELSACDVEAPVVSSVVPPSSGRAATLDLTLIGSNLQSLTTVSLDDDFVIHAIEHAPLDTIVVTVTVKFDAAPGPHDITVTTINESTTLVGGFLVESGVAPSPVHFVSPTGGDIYPYNSVLTAAHSFVDAVVAAEDGDVVRTAGNIHSVPSLSIQGGITLEGAWNEDFTARHVVYDRTTLDLGQNITVDAATGDVVFDSFEFVNGAGSLQVGPVIGIAGGALRINNSSVNLIDCDFHDNTAAFGGAIFAHASTLTLQNVGLSANGFGNYGGAVYVHTSNLDMTDCTLEDNLVQIDGGGLFLESSTTAIDGIWMKGNNCLFGGKGGALYASGGSLSLRHGLFFDNHAGSGGGAYLNAGLTGEIAASTLHTNDSGLFLDNAAVSVFNTIVSASVGDGITCVGTTPPVAYNLVWSSGGSDYVGCSPGTGSLSLDPLFVDAVGGDFHLALHAPGIDAGDPDPAHNDPDGSRSDMGRHGTGTFDMQQPSAPQGLTGERVVGETVLSWQSNPEGDIDFYAVYADVVGGFRPSAPTLLTTTSATSVNLGVVSETTYYRIGAVSQSGYAGGFSDELEMSGNTAVDTATPTAFFVDQAYPNPFNPTTTIEFGLPVATHVRVRILDLRGREVTILASRQFEAGTHRVTWDAQGVASGTYVALVNAGEREIRMKLSVVK